MVGKVERCETMLEELKATVLNTDMWVSMGFSILKIIVIVILFFIIRKIGHEFIERILHSKHKRHVKISVRRENTLVKLLQNVLTYILFFIATIMILSELHVDVTGLIAGAGIVGLAIGFGAQNLVKDIISGFFIFFEDQFAVGDEVQIGDFEGSVQEIGLRTTKILHWTGELYIIPNGSILNVTNYSVYNSIAIVDFSVDYSGGLHEVEMAIHHVLQGLQSKYKEIVSTPKLLGIEQLDGDNVIFRVTAETLPLEQKFIERQMRRELKIEIDQLLAKKIQIQDGEGD